MLDANTQYAQKQTAAAIASLQAALSALTTITSIQRDAEGSRFRGLFSHDNLSCLPNARREVLGALARIGTSVTAKAQASVWAQSNDALSCQYYTGMYDYQKTFAPKNFPLMDSTPETNMYLWPQAFCTLIFPSNTSTSHSWCLPSPQGGSFGGNATITLKSAQGGAVRYTTDGSTPTPASPIAHGPITITATTTVTVALADPTLAATVPPTAMTFVRVA